MVSENRTMSSKRWEVILRRERPQVDDGEEKEGHDSMKSPDSSFIGCGEEIATIAAFTRHWPPARSSLRLASLK